MLKNNHLIKKMYKLYSFLALKNLELIQCKLWLWFVPSVGEVGLKLIEINTVWETYLEFVRITLGGLINV